MGYEPDPQSLLPDDLGDLLFGADEETMPEVMRQVLALGTKRVDVPDERFRSVWSAIRAHAHPSVTEARALRALAQELAAASAAAPEDLGAWQRAELTEGLVGALDVDPFSAAYEAAYSVHRAVDDHDAVLAAVRCATRDAPKT